MDEYPTSRVNEERVRQLAETKVDDFAEKRVDLDIRTGHSLDVSIHEYGQALRNYQSYSSNGSQFIITFANIYADEVEEMTYVKYKWRQWSEFWDQTGKSLVFSFYTTNEQWKSQMSLIGRVNES